MHATLPALGADEWLASCRTIVSGMRAMLAGAPTILERAEETGTRGEGGDRTLVIDAAAETLVFAELERLADAGHRFTAVSEERGVVSFGSDATVVVIDPIDGSLNAKRGLPHHALSVAVADGPSTADVWFGYVFDFGPGEEWWAARGAGARLGGVLLDRLIGERRGRDGRLEVLGIESADPRWVALRADALEQTAYRLRALGTIASSLCQVAGGRFDGLVSLRNCRSVDAAAAQLIVREAGGLVSFPRLRDMPGAPLLDLEAHSPVVAARSAHTLAELELVAG
jgi:myo-inositol-1(or 4)-monophosphatase